MTNDLEITFCQPDHPNSSNSCVREESKMMCKIFVIILLIHVTMAHPPGSIMETRDTRNGPIIKKEEAEAKPVLFYSKMEKTEKIITNATDIEVNVDGNYTTGFVECLSKGETLIKSIRLINCLTMDECGNARHIQCLKNPEDDDEDACADMYAGGACGNSSIASTVTPIDPQEGGGQSNCVNVPIFVDDLNPGGILACGLEGVEPIFEFFALGADLKYHLTSDNQSWIPLALWVGNEQVSESKNFSVGEEPTFGCYATKFLYAEELTMGLVFDNGIIDYYDQNVTKEDNAYFWSILKMIKISKSVNGIACKALTASTGNDTKESHWVEQIFKFQTIDAASSPTENGGMNYGLSIGLSCAFIVIFLAISFLIFWRKYKRAKHKLRNLSPEEVHEFKMGSSSRSASQQQKEDGSGSHELAVSMPFDPKHEIPSTMLVIDKRSILGQGQFGTVFEGIFGDSRRVAVKTTKAHADVVYFKALLSEIKVMAYIGKMENIIEFLGAQTTHIEQRIAFLVFELSTHGDLCSLLKKKRRQEYESHDELTDADSAYVDLETLKTFGNYCRQIANGMRHLESKKLMHGDLAARNILVFDGDVVKVSDFGLSRRLYSYSKYFKKQKVALPWRWMPPEGLLYNEFSTQSDVWSFGVVVWEIFTFGAIPYTHETWSLDFMQKLKAGHLRLHKPSLAPQPIYDEMLKCWTLHPAHRPTFEDLHANFQNICQQFPKPIITQSQAT